MAEPSKLQKRVLYGSMGTVAAIQAAKYIHKHSLSAGQVGIGAGIVGAEFAAVHLAHKKIKEHLDKKRNEIR